MAIEDKRYEELTGALKAFMGTGRHQFVQSQLIKLAYSILRHYGYEVVEVPVVAVQPGATAPSATKVD